MYDRDQELKILCNVGPGRELLDSHNESHAKDVKAMTYLFPTSSPCLTRPLLYFAPHDAWEAVMTAFAMS
jgi:hypothetical protein